MRLRSSFVMAGLFAAALSGLFAVGCGGPKANPSKPEAPNASADVNVDVGTPLYKAKADVKPAAVLGAAPDALIVPSTAQFEDRQQVASEVDGKIDELGYRDDTIDPKDPNCIYHPRDDDKKFKYRKLKEGDIVKAGWVIAILDDQIWSTKKESA